MVDQVCIALPDGMADEMPLVSLVGMTGFVLLPPETERAHYEFLEDCSVEQAANLYSRKQNSSDTKGPGQEQRSAIENMKPQGASDSSMDIGWVCPALAVPADTQDSNGA